MIPNQEPIIFNGAWKSKQHMAELSRSSCLNYEQTNMSIGQCRQHTGTFPSLAWKIADSSTIPWQDISNHVVKNCILLYEQNLNLHFGGQQLHPQPRTSFKLVGWLSSKTRLKSGLTP